MSQALPAAEAAPIPTAQHQWAKSDSIMRQLMDVAVGDTVSKANRYPAALTTFEEVRQIRDRMSNVLSGQISKVRNFLEHSDKKFTTSIGHYTAVNGDVIVCAAVTRTE